MKRLCVWFLLALWPAVALAAPERVHVRLPGAVPVDIEANLINILVGRSVTATGDVVVVRGTDNMRAQQVTVDLRTEDIVAQGNVLFTQPGRRLNAAQLRYNPQTGAASAQQVTVAIPAPEPDVTYYLQGESLTGVYKTGVPLTQQRQESRLIGGLFTTCDPERRDWAVRAQEIILRPGDRVVARHVSLILFGNRLITLPKIGFSLAEAGGSSLFPRLTFSSRDLIGLRSDYILKLPAISPSRGYAVLSAKHVIRTGAGFDRLAGLPIGIRAGYQEDAVSRFRAGLTVSDFPAITFFLPRGISPSGPLQLGMAVAPTAAEMLKGEIDGGRWERGRALRILAYGSAGHYNEQPTQVTADRLDLEGAIETQPLSVLSNLDLGGALRGRVSFYSTGDEYDVLTPEVSASWQPSQADTIRGSWRYHRIRGDTPFFFDRVDSPSTLLLGWQNRTRARSFGTNLEFDLQHGSLYAWDVSYSKRLHCLQPGIVVRKRGSDFGIGITLAIPGIGGTP